MAASSTPSSKPTDTAKPATLTTSPSAGDESEELRLLRDENAKLRAELADAKSKRDEAGNAAANPRKPVEPSFGISEGTRDELERTGKATSPFTGKPLTKDDLNQ